LQPESQTLRLPGFLPGSGNRPAQDDSQSVVTLSGATGLMVASEPNYIANRGITHSRRMNHGIQPA